MAEPALRERVTVVLLTYNSAHRVGPIMQRLLSLEVPVIAVDNASTDGTVDLLRRCPQVEIVALPHNIGAAARNIGLERARTPYVAFCDDDGWPERAGLAFAVGVLDAHPRIGLLAARVIVGDEGTLDPLSAEMAASPLAADDGLPGMPVWGFMAGAVVVRAEAYRQAGGYDARFFISGEEETLAYKLARLGWQLRYVPDMVVRHYPSGANAPRLRPYLMRNTMLNAWLHRRFRNAVRCTLFTLVDTPKDADWLRGVVLTVRGLGWVIRGRKPMPRPLDDQLRSLDTYRFKHRRR